MCPALLALPHTYTEATCVVLASYLPYVIPSLEVRSLVTVAVFGPLTLIQPVVVVAGVIAGVSVHPSWPALLLLAAGAFIALTFERLLDRIGWAAREAALDDENEPLA